MGRTLLTAALALGALAACSHAPDSAPPRALPFDDQPVVQVAPPAAETPVARPRLSRTVTLGQGAQEAYQPSPDPPAAPGPSSNVVVNNNVTVIGASPVYGYGGYGYGYGGWGYGWGGGGRDARVGSSTRNWGSQPWGSTGWEGAQRTAPAGQTPGVGAIGHRLLATARRR
ncbi:hypothetical protein [Labilithrix luteola]|uniref:hypothetical protein n=1 Tax=Labilithrix luteola TaxID=1391654 RepID=UPI0011BADA13|nr:hypothetical protein [Labilithrix luteola]